MNIRNTYVLLLKIVREITILRAFFDHMNHIEFTNNTSSIFHQYVN